MQTFNLLAAIFMRLLVFHTGYSALFMFTRLLNCVDTSGSVRYLSTIYQCCLFRQKPLHSFLKLPSLNLLHISLVFRLQLFFL